MNSPCCVCVCVCVCVRACARQRASKCARKPLKLLMIFKKTLYELHCPTGKSHFLQQGTQTVEIKRVFDTIYTRHKILLHIFLMYFVTSANVFPQVIFHLQLIK
jgi:hypothetical protein